MLECWPSGGCEPVCLRRRGGPAVRRPPDPIDCTAPGSRNGGTRVLRRSHGSRPPIPNLSRLQANRLIELNALPGEFPGLRKFRTSVPVRVVCPRGHRVCFQRCAGPLAQLVEHLTFNQGVEGSIPSRPTSNLLKNTRFFDKNDIRPDRDLQSRRHLQDHGSIVHVRQPRHPPTIVTQSKTC